MEIQAQKIERPFKLSDIASYFDIPAKTLEQHLEFLANKQELFAHDIKQTGNDYMLSRYAVTLVILNFYMSREYLAKLDTFMEKHSEEDAPGTFLAKLFIYGNTLHEKVQTLQLQQETAEINRDIAKNKDLLDGLIKFGPAASLAIN